MWFQSCMHGQAARTSSWALTACFSSCALDMPRRAVHSQPPVLLLLDRNVTAPAAAPACSTVRPARPARSRCRDAELSWSAFIALLQLGEGCSRHHRTRLEPRNLAGCRCCLDQVRRFQRFQSCPGHPKLVHLGLAGAAQAALFSQLCLQSSIFVQVRYPSILRSAAVSFRLASSSLRRWASAAACDENLSGSAKQSIVQWCHVASFFFHHPRRWFDVEREGWW